MYCEGCAERLNETCPYCKREVHPRYIVHHVWEARGESEDVIKRAAHLLIAAVLGHCESAEELLELFDLGDIPHHENTLRMCEGITGFYKRGDALSAIKVANLMNESTLFNEETRRQLAFIYMVLGTQMMEDDE